MVGFGVGVILVLLHPVEPVEVGVEAVKTEFILHPEQHKECTGETDG
jgi:hypothetical protein